MRLASRVTSAMEVVAAPSCHSTHVGAPDQPDTGDEEEGRGEVIGLAYSWLTAVLCNALEDSGMALASFPFA